MLQSMTLSNEQIKIKKMVSDYRPSTLSDLGGAIFGKNGGKEQKMASFFNKQSSARSRLFITPFDNGPGLPRTNGPGMSGGSIKRDLTCNRF